MAGPWRMVSRTTGKTIVARLQIADSYGSRLLGLQFRRALAPDSGLLLVPCNSVHTCFMRFPVDVVFLDRVGVVLAIHRNVVPWRVAFGPRRGHATLELPGGACTLQTGETLRLESVDGSDIAPPPSVAFLRK